MRFANEVLISFFESQQSALRGRALVEATRGRRGPRSRSVVVSREGDGSRSHYEVPTRAPLGGAVGLALGGILGSYGGEAGLVVGLFFGLYAGLFVDLWRTLARCDLLDQIQDGLAPGQAAVVSFVRDSTASSIERSLAETAAVTVHRFPGAPIEEDVAREVREATVEVGRLVDARDRGDGGFVDRKRRIAAARQRLSVLEAVASRLLWLEQLQFETETRILNRQRREVPGWRAARLRGLMVSVRASHRRCETMLEASRDRVRAAAALSEGIAI